MERKSSAAVSDSMIVVICTLRFTIQKTTMFIITDHKRRTIYFGLVNGLGQTAMDSVSEQGNLRTPMAALTM